MHTTLQTRSRVAASCRIDSGRPDRTSAPHPPNADSVERTGALAARSAELMPPPPSGDLRHDRAAWAGFAELLHEAGALLADAADRDRAVLKASLAPLNDNPQARVLVEIALEHVGSECVQATTVRRPRGCGYDTLRPRRSHSRFGRD